MPVNFQDRRSDFRGHLVRGGRQERETGVRDLYLLLQSVRQDHDLSAGKSAYHFSLGQERGLRAWWLDDGCMCDFESVFFSGARSRYK